MNNLGQVTLAEIGRALKRYQPFIAIVIAVLLVVAFLPGDPPPSGSVAAGDVEIADTGSGNGGSGGDTAGDATDGTSTGGTAQGSTGSSSSGTSSSGGGRSASTGTGGSGGGSAQAVSLPDRPVANCDTARGRLALPVHVSPPCTAAYDGANGGSTYQGVTADTIKVAIYVAQANAAVDAALTAAGANNTPEERRATIEGFNEIFNNHYNLWGRKVELVFYEASGPSDDDAAAKADAIEIATGVKAFAVINAPGSNAFPKELAARGVLCICTASQPNEFYESLDPYVGYTSLPSSTQGYIHRAEYICKRVAKRKAKFAGDPTLQLQERKFGILYFETADNAYAGGVDFFEGLLAKCGVKLAVRLGYTGPPDLATTQEQARPFIQKMKDEGVTSVIFSGDFLSPAIFTQEATRQRYNPEWILTGSALTDTTIFARTYDKSQWAHAFGISYLSARYPDEEGDVYNLYQWALGRTPEADNQFGVIYAGMLPLYLGMMLAGENLTPQSFQAGLFAFPPTGAGMKTASQVSWGDHGFWGGMRDYTAVDNVAEIWWDNAATGEDEVGNPGAGMYRYVNGGERYLPGQHPNSDTTAFNPEGTVTTYETRPEAERAPQYPPPQK